MAKWDDPVLQGLDGADIAVFSDMHKMTTWRRFFGFTRCQSVLALCRV
jgi:hypothetical protein